MKITKYGHCCLYIDIQGILFLTDPGSFSILPEVLPRVDFLVLTHEHADHVHTETVKKILMQQPHVRVITNTAVARLLDGICSCEIVEHMQRVDCNGISLAAYGEAHAIVHDSITPVQNTGYLFDETLFYPGDALTVPGIPIDVLALPTAGPWIKISEALTYAVDMHPRVVVPVHDGVYLKPDMMNPLIQKVLTAQGIACIQLEHGVATEV
jgi:L-ascorbate metabolism protein UlaG (beta-lactamase superfamily)